MIRTKAEQPWQKLRRDVANQHGAANESTNAAGEKAEGHAHHQGRGSMGLRMSDVEAYVRMVDQRTAMQHTNLLSLIAASESKTAVKFENVLAVVVRIEELLKNRVTRSEVKPVIAALVIVAAAVTFYLTFRK